MGIFRALNLVFDLLVESGCDLNAHGKDAASVLHLAARNGKIDFVKTLISKGAELNAIVPSSGYTALHHAAKEGHAEIVEFLVESGANFTLETRKGFTPLHLAVKYANLAELKFLVDVGQCLKSGSILLEYVP